MNKHNNKLTVLLGKIRNNKVLSAGIGYTIGNYFLKGLGFVTVPVFSRIMEVSDYGIYNTFLSYESMLYLFIGLALHSSIKNAKYKYGDIQLNAYTSSITLIPLSISLFVLILGNVFFFHISKYIKIGRLEYTLLILYCLCSSLLYIFQSRLIIEYKTNKYLGISYFNALVSVACSFILIKYVFVEEKYLGRIIGTVIPMVLIAIWILNNLYKAAKPSINVGYWKFGLKISLPIIPHGIGQVVLTSFDRIMITNILGSAQAGLYSFAYTLYSIILVAGNSISSIFEPWAFEKISNNDISTVKQRAAQYTMILAVISSGVMLVAPELVIILGSSKYVAAVPAVTPIMFAGFFTMAYSLPAIIEYYYEKTTYIALGTTVAALINVVLNAWLIPRFGYVAAAYTTLISCALYFVFHCVVSYNISKYCIIPMHSLTLSLFLLLISAIISRISVGNLIFRYVWLLVVAGMGITIIIKFFKAEG